MMEESSRKAVEKTEARVQVMVTEASFTEAGQEEARADPMAKVMVMLGPIKTAFQTLVMKAFGVATIKKAVPRRRQHQMSGEAI